MTADLSPAGLAPLVQRALDLADGRDRILIGIAGSPGAGKTTLARLLVEAINTADGPRAAAVPMDGFHLANSTLRRLGLHDRKGAIETFDGWGFVALLRRLRAETDHVVYAPSFDRNVEEGIAGELAVEPGTRVVVVEGNYLLAEHGPWGQVREVLDECWFCDAPDAERFERLVERHVRHGRTEAAAKDWATNVDGANATRIQATRTRADLVVSGLDFAIESPRTRALSAE